jgi:hypothetical protein
MPLVGHRDFHSRHKIDIDYHYTKIEELMHITRHVTAVLEENDVTYMISDGTLLGWERHRGFIQNDDDVDIRVQGDVMTVLKPYLDTCTKTEYTYTDTNRKIYWELNLDNKDCTQWLQVFSTESRNKYNFHLDVVTSSRHCSIWKDVSKYLTDLKKDTFAGIPVYVPRTLEARKELLQHLYGRRYFTLLYLNNLDIVFVSLVFILFVIIIFLSYTLSYHACGTRTNKKSLVVHADVHDDF